MTFEQLKRQAIAEREALDESAEPRIYVATASCGHASGAWETWERIKAELDQRNLAGRVIEVGCIGSCYLEPLVAIARRGRPRIWYSRTIPETVPQFIEDCIVNDDPRPDLALGSTGEGKVDGIPQLMELPFFQSQKRIALRHCGHVDPASIHDYIARDGYSGLNQALGMTPEAVIEEIEKSGLRGRGGAGFPTGRKWRLGREAPGSEKFIVCNAANSDPGAYTDRALLEGDPHSMIEGMLIGAYAIDASRSYIYVPVEYSLSIARLQTALEQAEKHGLAGNDILGSGFTCHIEIKEGAAAFVGGEETALIRALEGKRPMPYPRPPFPTESGLEGKPTVINNVETLANVPAILQKGTVQPATGGTKALTLGGQVARPGLIEVPLGTTLRQIIYDIGGGLPEGGDFKVALVGGPTGGLLPESTLDTLVDYESLNVAGAIMGSGSIVVADSHTCIVDLGKKCLAFTRAESCGKCVFCREGTMQLHEILTDITEGKASPDAIDRLRELAEGIRLGSLCALGGTAPNPVLTAIKHFREEFDAHVERHQCPAGVCRQLVS